jgi:hypothetical protein
LALVFQSSHVYLGESSVECLLKVAGVLPLPDQRLILHSNRFRSHAAGDDRRSAKVNDCELAE